MRSNQDTTRERPVAASQQWNLWLPSLSCALNCTRPPAHQQQLHGLAWGWAVPKQAPGAWAPCRRYFACCFMLCRMRVPWGFAPATGLALLPFSGWTLLENFHNRTVGWVALVLLLLVVPFTAAPSDIAAAAGPLPSMPLAAASPAEAESTLWASPLGMGSVTVCKSPCPACSMDDAAPPPTPRDPDPASPSPTTPLPSPPLLLALVLELVVEMFRVSASWSLRPASAAMRS
ncbi:hypothetical protein V8C86DRAFT_1300584 [Haematococcus lacustris]